MAAAVKVAVDPRDTDTDMGWAVMVGGTLTVNVAVDVMADPAALVNTARYSYPLLVDGTLLIVKVVDVAPATSENVPPPLVLTLHHDPSSTNNHQLDQYRDVVVVHHLCVGASRVPCHWTVGVGDPDAAAANVAAAPAVTVVEAGFDVTDGGTLTINVAGVVVADPAALVNTA